VTMMLMQPLKMPPAPRPASNEVSLEHREVYQGSYK
jgi:hypothetical protein